MKTPDSRPRNPSATRHYHRYRAESSDGWSTWVDGARKPGKPKRGDRWKWLLAAGGVVGLATLLGVVFLKVL